MNINWKARFKNPVWWAEVAASVVLPMLAAIGLSWADMTTWEALWEAVKTAVANPVVVVAMGVSLWNAITDPTTAGLGDSVLAMTYKAPRKDDTAEERGL
jgi:phi LC3 family holin